MEIDNYRINRLYLECVNELETINIQISDQIKQVIINNRAKKRLGCCKKKSENNNEFYYIEISDKMLEKRDVEIKEVIIHELLHTCEGCMNHGSKWKAEVNKVNKCYGYNITTTSKLNSEQIINGSYLIKCNKCGQENIRIRKTKIVMHPEMYRCGKCGGELRAFKISK